MEKEKNAYIAHCLVVAFDSMPQRTTRPRHPNPRYTALEAIPMTDLEGRGDRVCVGE
jgi:hypothetical protein